MASVECCEVKHNNMLCLFSGDELELPYRFQPDLAFIVSFEEYKEFVNNLISCNLECLSFGLDSYKKAVISDNDSVLKKFYYFDLSRAIINELRLAANCGADGTVILHDFSKPCRAIVCKEVDNELLKLPPDNIQKAIQSFFKDNSNRFDTKKLSKHNLFLWRYALYLRTACYSPTIEEIKLEGLAWI